MSETPQRDWTKTLDLSRTKLTQDLVDQMEDAMRRQQTAADDLKAIYASAAEKEYEKRDIVAMKTVARLRLKDEKADAQQKLEALERIGRAVEFDLFDFAAVRG